MIATKSHGQVGPGINDREWIRAAAPEPQRRICMPVTVDQAGKLDTQSWTICPGALPDVVDS